MTGNHVSLFSGVGMLDLAAESAGFKTVATAEVLPFCRDLLRLRFPDAAHYEDVMHVRSRLAVKRDKPLLISGGSPCQGFSDSGYRGGLADSRSKLLLEMLRIVEAYRPEYVLIENSPLLLKRGGEKVLQRLMDAGYHIRWECIPAAYVNAPHMRDRVWIMARLTPFPRPASYRKIGEMPRAGIAGPGFAWEVDPLCTRKSARRDHRLMPTPTKSDGTGGPGTTPKREGGLNLRTFAALREGSGRLNPSYVEWMMGLPHGWTDPSVPSSALVQHQGWRWLKLPHDRHAYVAWPLFPPILNTPGTHFIPMTVHDNPRHRSKRIQALGNGLVPQVASIALDILVNS